MTELDLEEVLKQADEASSAEMVGIDRQYRVRLDAEKFNLLISHVANLANKDAGHRPAESAEEGAFSLIYQKLKSAMPGEDLFAEFETSAREVEILGETLKVEDYIDFKWPLADAWLSLNQLLIDAGGRDNARLRESMEKFMDKINNLSNLRGEVG